MSAGVRKDEDAMVMHDPADFAADIARQAIVLDLVEVDDLDAPLA